MPDVKEKLVELMRGFFESVYPKFVYEGIADHLIDNGVTIQKWISVEERLPDMRKRRYEDCVEPTGYGEYFASDTVLTYCPQGNIVCVAECSRSNEEGQVCWDDASSGLAIHPTHWMPMPEPPKEMKEK